jgi:DNA-binding MarR family transcriptional regulator
MRGRERLLADLERELTLIGRHQLVRVATGSLDRSAYLVLCRIDATGPMTARELADALRLEISTVTRQVGAMLRDDLVERVADPAGGTARRLRITPTGTTRLATDRDRHRTGLDTVVTDWPDTECAELCRLLRALNERIETHQGTPWPRED